MRRISFIFLLIFWQSVAAAPLKILAIGNSFSEDAVENYLYDIGKDKNIEFVIGNLFIGGCSLEAHWNNAMHGNAVYQYRKIENGSRTVDNAVRLETVLQDENWDYITIQQVSYKAGIQSSYYPYMVELLRYIRQRSKNPNLKVGFHMIWAYQQNSQHSGFIHYENNQYKMYQAIVDAANQIVADSAISVVIPSGTAIQNARTSSLGDKLCRDGYHLDLNIGRYIAACTWFEAITGIDVTTTSFRPANISESKAHIARQAAHFAVECPFLISSMAGGE